MLGEEEIAGLGKLKEILMRDGESAVVKLNLHPHPEKRRVQHAGRKPLHVGQRLPSRVVIPCPRWRGRRT